MTWDISKLENLVSELFYGKGSTYGGLEPMNQFLVSGVFFVGVLLLAVFLYYFIRRVLLGLFVKLVKATKNSWDNDLMRSGIFRRLAMLAPVILVWQLSPYIFSEGSKVAAVGGGIEIGCEVLIVLLLLLAVFSLLNLIERIYRRFEASRQLPIKSFFQVIKILLSMVGLILMVSIIIGKSPLLLFSGLGAMTAILLLVFKDSILGFVAGIQLSANRLVARGDWIEMPKFGADGEVLEVALTTVKVRNWDKTITTIPTYSLIADSFKNWRGMSQSGVRRIKRSLFLDMGAVRFLDDEMLARMKKVSLLEEYLAEKEADIDMWNSERNTGGDDPINSRGMTNLGTFRAYVNAYLNNHAKISKADTILVRLLQPGQHGVPLEIYVFTNDNNWIEFERIQSDIFDHLLAVLNEFGLRVFQSPSGADVLRLGGKGVEVV